MISKLNECPARFRVFEKVNEWTKTFAGCGCTKNENFAVCGCTKNESFAVCGLHFEDDCFLPDFESELTEIKRKKIKWEDGVVLALCFF